MGRRRSYPPASPPSTRSYTDLPTILVVRNIDQYDLVLSLEDLRMAFEQFGPLKDVYLPDESGYRWEPWVARWLREPAVGYVHFVDPADAAEAKYQMDGQLLLGREISVTLFRDFDHVTVSFARSGGPADGQNVNKVKKVNVRFNVPGAHWLSKEVRDKILQMEKNRINKDGELVISSTKTRTHEGNIEDALEKIQAIIEAASYVPPPPSEEKLEKIAKLAAEAAQKRIQNKKVLSQKKALRTSRAVMTSTEQQFEPA